NHNTFIISLYCSTPPPGSVTRWQRLGAHLINVVALRSHRSNGWLDSLEALDVHLIIDLGAADSEHAQFTGRNVTVGSWHFLHFQIFVSPRSICSISRLPISRCCSYLGRRCRSCNDEDPQCSHLIELSGNVAIR